MLDERLRDIFQGRRATQGGGVFLMDVPTDPETLFGAWCVLLYRRSEQDSFELDVVEHQGNGWFSRTAQVEMQGDELAVDIADRLATLYGSTGESREAAMQLRRPLGFSYVGADTPIPGAMDSEVTLCSGLHLICIADELGTRCLLSYDKERYDEVTIEQMLAQYRALVMALRNHPELPIRFLPMLTPDERGLFLDLWSGSKVERCPDLAFQRFERQATARPDAVAVSLNSSSISYGELNRLANRLARWLGKRGVKNGSHVAVCMEPRIEFLVCMLAIFKAGATHVPLDPGYPDERLVIIFEDTNPSVLFTERNLLPKLQSLPIEPVCLEAVADELATLADDNLNNQIAPEQIAYIVYTSGTTGKPKGVMASHANLSHYLAVARDAYGYNEMDIIPAIARFTFSITFFELLSPLTAGASLVLLDRSHVLDMSRMVKTLTESTCIHCSPSLWRKIIGFIDEQGFDQSAFQNMRHVSSGGDMVPPDVLESLKRLFVNAEVFVIYGCSEVSCMGCTYPVPRDRVLQSTRVGKPFPNMSLRLLDANGELVPPGVIGEVCFGGDGLAVGYLNLPELTAEKFVDFAGERLYHTGDLGRVDSDGNLELVGRSDFQIKLRGIRMEAAEIEAHIRAMPGVKDAVVAAPTLQDGEKRLVAFVVPDPAAPLTSRQIREFLKKRLPDYMIPAAFVQMDAFPVNVNLKVDRLALSRLTALPETATAPADPPRTDLERRLVEIWERVLQMKGIGIRDEFWEVGGDSLRSVALMSAIDRELGIALPVSTLFTEPTIEQLAALCDAGADSAAVSLICLKKGTGERPAVFFVHDGAGESMPYLNLALRLHEGHSVYGIHPKSSRYHPILHTRLHEMVDYYISLMKSVQPTGPYFVGGLCIGGFLAFEIARKLTAMGEEVGPVGLIDVAHVTTPPRSVAARRLNRLSSELSKSGSGDSVAKVVKKFTVVARRARNVIVYETSSRFTKRKTRLKLKLLRALLDRGLPLPAFLRGISVDAVLRFAEKEYVVPAPYQGKTLLFRATSRDPALAGIVNDTPYIEIFGDPMLGWDGKVTDLIAYDIPAGHSSTLREPNVKIVAEALQRHIDASLSSRA